MRQFPPGSFTKHAWLLLSAPDVRVSLGEHHGYSTSAAAVAKTQFLPFRAGFSLPNRPFVQVRLPGHPRLPFGSVRLLQNSKAAHDHYQRGIWRYVSTRWPERSVTCSVGISAITPPQVRYACR